MWAELWTAASGLRGGGDDEAVPMMLGGFRLESHKRRFEAKPQLRMGACECPGAISIFAGVAAFCDLVDHSRTSSFDSKEHGACDSQTCTGGGVGDPVLAMLLLPN